MSNQRPFGVTVIALVQGVNAATLGAEVATARRTLPGPQESEPALLTVGGLIVLAGLVNAAGLWRLQRWAWVATMLWTGLVLGLGLAAYVDGNASYPVMVISLLQVLYLNQSEVQQAFRRRRPARPPSP